MPRVVLADEATTLIQDTLRWLPTTPSRYPAYLAQLGTLAHRRGDYAEAERHYQQVHTLVERLSDQAGVAKSHHQLGNLAYLRGDYAEAERRNQQALTIKTQIGDQSGVATAHYQLGVLAQAHGDYAEAERRYQQALTTFEQLGNQASAATSCSQLAMLRATTGDTTTAIHLHIQALTLRLAIGVPQAANNVARLVELRHQVADFADIARQVLGEDSYTNLIAVLDDYAP